MDDFFFRLGVDGVSTIEPLATKREFLVEVSQRVIAAARKTMARNATIATKAKMTPRAYSVRFPREVKNRSSLAVREVKLLNVVKSTIPIPARGNSGRRPGSS